jgi:hypothetical protein
VPNFVEFSRQSARSSRDDPMFTLQRRGLISLNEAAFKALGEPASVVFLYDADEGIVALRKVPRSYANGYHVRKQANARSYLVAAQGFTSFYDLKTDMPKRFTGHDYGDQTWGFVLSEGTEVHFKTRRRSSGTEDGEDVTDE